MFEVDKRYLFVSSAVTIIQSLAPAISLLIMQQIINLIQQGIQSITFILQLVVLYVCIDLASTIISGLMNYYTTKFSLKFNLHIKDCIMQKASQLSLWHYENSNTYDKIKLAEGANGGTLMSQFTSFTTLIGQVKSIEHIPGSSTSTDWRKPQTIVFFFFGDKEVNVKRFWIPIFSTYFQG